MSKNLRKLKNKGFRGYPIATVAYYGPDDTRATKVAVGIVIPGTLPKVIERWYDDAIDVRVNKAINEEIINFIKKNHAKSVVMADRFLGCPHEEGVDYPLGSKCPQCPFWAIRDRFTGEIIQ